MMEGHRIVRGALWGILFSLILWATLLLTAYIALAQSTTRVVGYDYLAAQHKLFNVKKAIEFIPDNSALGTLDVTFGDSITPIRDLLNSRKFTFYRVHLINGPGLRNGVAAQNEITYGYNVSSFNSAVVARNPRIINYVKRRTLIYKNLQEKEFVDIKFAVSPMLEHNLSTAAYRVLADTVKSVWPSIQLVNNKLEGDGETYLGSWREHHGQNPRDNVQISSLDGEDGTDINVPKWLQETAAEKYTYMWSRSYNCRDQADNFTPPLLRKACPKDYQFEELAMVPVPRPEEANLTSPCGRNTVAWDSTKIWKPMAEDEGTNDPRANLPVAIFKAPASTMEVVSRRGRVMGKMGYYGKFSDGVRNRYYSGRGTRESGYQLEKKAKLDSGSSYVWLRNQGKCYGPFIPGRRAGDFR